MTIDEYIAAEIAKPYQWGETDCASTADRWVELRTGTSPMGAFGRRHSNEAEARAWLAEPYGLAVAMNRVMRAAGLAKTGKPQVGDIGLILYDGKTCVSIHAGRHWFSRSETGLVAAPLGNVWKAWAIRPAGMSCARDT